MQQDYSTTMSTVELFDQFAWRSQSFTYDYKQSQHVESPWVSQKTLLIYRTAAAFILLAEI